MITIEKLAGLCTVQDLGRPGRLHQGLPAGGAMDPARLIAANLAVGNEPGDAGLELAGIMKLSLVGLPRPVSIDGAAPERLVPGEVLEVATRGARCVHVAIAGGVGVPQVMGSRATLLCAGLGGHHGRALRPGDQLPLGGVWHGARTVPPLPQLDLVRVTPGPDLDRFPAGALEALAAAELRMGPTGDRVGVRLVHSERQPPWRPREATAPSAPMIRGAIQVTPSGECIVLGPEHPVTGGYPLIGVVHTDDVGPLMVRLPGSRVALTIV